jgi:hypothetical protein
MHLVLATRKIAPAAGVASLAVRRINGAAFKTFMGINQRGDLRDSLLESEVLPISYCRTDADADP